VLTKLHLKRNATDRFALCGILPDRNFALMDEVSHHSLGAVCRTCVGIATFARNDAGTERSTQATSKELTSF